MFKFNLLQKPQLGNVASRFALSERQFAIVMQSRIDYKAKHFSARSTWTKENSNAILGYTCRRPYTTSCILCFMHITDESQCFQRFKFVHDVGIAMISSRE